MTPRPYTLNSASYTLKLNKNSYGWPYRLPQKNIVNLVQARRTKHSKYVARDLSLEKGKWDRLQIVSGKEMAVCVSG